MYSFQEQETGATGNLEPNVTAGVQAAEPGSILSAREGFTPLLPFHYHVSTWPTLNQRPGQPLQNNPSFYTSRDRNLMWRSPSMPIVGPGKPVRAEWLKKQNTQEHHAETSRSMEYGLP